MKWWHANLNRTLPFFLKNHFKHRKGQLGLILFSLLVTLSFSLAQREMLSCPAPHCQSVSSSFSPHAAYSAASSFERYLLHTGGGGGGREKYRLNTRQESSSLSVCKHFTHAFGGHIFPQRLDPVIVDCTIYNYFAILLYTVNWEIFASRISFAIFVLGTKSKCMIHQKLFGSK